MADGAGRPPFVPTSEQRAVVTGMAAIGVRHELICSRIINPATGAPIDRKTLRRTFREELAGGMVEANQLMATSVFQSGINGNLGAQIWWLKNRAPDEWKDRTEQLHGGVPGSPIQIIAGTPDAEV